MKLETADDLSLPVGLILLLGGARSGKSALAVELATQSNKSVVFIATAQAHDEDMKIESRDTKPSDLVGQRSKHRLI